MPSAYRFNLASGEIRRARRYVGSVRRAEDSVRFVGRIGQHCATARDATTAFREVSALAMGFASLSALRARNAEIRRSNRTNRALRASAFYSRPAQPAASLDPAALVARLQQEARDVGETPLTADEIMNSWIRSAR